MVKTAGTDSRGVGQNGERDENVRKSFEEAKERVGIVDFKFHDLRHTFASHLVMAGVE